MRAEDWPTVREIYIEGLGTGQASFETEAPDWEQWDSARLPICRLVACDAEQCVAALQRRASNRYVLLADISRLALTRQQFSDPDEHIILPELATKHFVGPAVKQGDEDWFSVVRWTLYALIAAEELDITSANVDAMKASASEEIRGFLGVDLDLGKRLGLSADWTQRIVKQVGNYGELFDRNLGAKSPMRLERRLNKLAGNGGLHYAPSFR